MRKRIGLVLLAAFLCQAGKADRPAKPPKDAPFCPAPGTRPLFVAPMGEVFHGEPNEAYPSALWLKSVDRDGDGKVSRTEMIDAAARFFKQLDRDGDGRLTPDEVARYEQEVAPEISLYAGRREPQARRRGGLFSGGEGAAPAAPVGAGRYAWLDIPEPVAAADADLDRIVTAAEFRAAASSRFDTLAAGQPSLSASALPRTPQQQAFEGPCRPRPKQREFDWDNDDTDAGASGR
jgi:hypothetical protein